MRAAPSYPSRAIARPGPPKGGTPNGNRGFAFAAGGRVRSVRGVSDGKVESSAAGIETRPAGAAREERIHALDNLRAVAMWLGIVLHAGISFMLLETPWPVRDVARHWSFDVLVGAIHGFRMQLFFFLAGFFARLLHERLGAWGFAKHRLLRIGVPLVAGMVVILPMVGALWFWGMSQRENPIVLPFEQRPRLGSIPSGHLWFLQYLLVFYALSMGVVAAGGRLPTRVLAAGDRAFDWLFRTRMRALWWVPPTVVCLWNGPMWGEVEAAGMDSVIRLRVVGYYGLFFVAGWWLHRRRLWLGELSRFLKMSFGVAVVTLLVHWSLLSAALKPEHPHYTGLKVVSLSCAALYAWLMTFAVTGWFLRFAGQHRPWVRYLADASYWCYLLHLVPVMWLQIVLGQWRVNGWLKFALMNVVTMVFLLVSYHWCVRFTFIGTVLNGRRTRGAL